MYEMFTKKVLMNSMLLNIGRKRVQIANISTAYRNLGHRMQVRNDIYLVEQRNNYAKATGWPEKRPKLSHGIMQQGR